MVPQRARRPGAPCRCAGAACPGHCGDVPPVDGDGAAAELVKTHEQVHQRGLSAPVGPRWLPSRWAAPQVQVLHQNAVRRIAKTHVWKLRRGPGVICSAPPRSSGTPPPRPAGRTPARPRDGGLKGRDDRSPQSPARSYGRALQLRRPGAGAGPIECSLTVGASTTSPPSTPTPAAFPLSQATMTDTFTYTPAQPGLQTITLTVNGSIGNTPAPSPPAWSWKSSPLRS